MFLNDSSNNGGSNSGNGGNKTAAGLRGVLGYLRVGMKKVKPVRGAYFENRDGSITLDSANACRACAVGTIVIGTGEATSFRNLVEEVVRLVDDMIPEFHSKCPNDEWEDYKCGVLIEHLFEYHKWDRGRIARWMEKKINELEAESVTASIKL